MHGVVWLSVALALDPGASILASWNDGHGLVSHREEVRTEIDSILEEAGIRVRWSDGEDGLANGGKPGVVVVLTPSEPTGDGWHLSPSAMGVYLSAEESSAVYVFYHRVARVLGVASGMDGMMVPSDRKRLAKALGRVVVHELVHRIAPELPHAESGVMRGDLGRSFLTRRSLPLDDGSRAAVLSALEKKNAKSRGTN